MEEMRFGMQYVVDNVLGKNPNDNPVFYIKYGPPGSGKATVLDTLARKIGRDTTSVVSVDIDDIVSKFPRYQEQRERLLQDSTLSNIEKSRETGELYWSVRTKCDVVSDELFKAAMKCGLDIGFETTGSRVEWLKTQVLPAVRARATNKPTYGVFLVYPFVSTEKLIERVKTREAETGQKGADEATILNSVYAAQDNIVGLIGDIDELFIYDNNGSKGAETVLVHVVVGDNGYSVYDCAQDKRYFCKTVKKFTDKLRELLLGFCGCED